MFEKPFKIEVVTPAKVVFSGDIAAVSVPGTVGGFQILHNHAPLLSSLEIGTITIKGTDGGDVRYATTGGFAEVRDNRVVLIVDSAERADEIDVDRARRSRRRAEERLRTRSSDLDIVRAQASLARAMNRLRVAGAL